MQRLAANSFRFTESPRTLNNREYVKRDANNAIDFMESSGYIRLKADMSVTSKELYAIYGIWCDENGLTPIRQRSFSDFLMRNLKTYNLERKLKPYFKDGKLPITAWRREREQLEQEYKDIQTELSPLHADAKKLWAIHYNIYEVQHEQERQNTATRQKRQEIEH